MWNFETLLSLIFINKKWNFGYVVKYHHHMTILLWALYLIMYTYTINDESYAGEKFHGLLDFIMM